jgi:uncharacterized protein
MKYVLLVAVVGVVLWLMFGRGRRTEQVRRRETKRAERGQPEAPVTMLQCAHCGVHLPKSDALFDAGGRPYCGEPHRLAGPRA